MKRIKFACLEQTIHFMLKDDIPNDVARKEVVDEIEKYKHTLDKKHIKFQVIDENKLDDGSIILKLKKQYNTYDVGEYFN